MTKEILSRTSKAVRQQQTILLAQIVAGETDFSHRDKAAFDEKKLQPLTDSLVVEGVNTPLVVAPTDDFIVNEGKPMPTYFVVSGTRRWRALLGACDAKTDTAVHPQMELLVTIMSPGPDQSVDDYRQDLLIASVADNEIRQSLSAVERLRVIAKFESTNVSLKRAAAALGVSESQYRRDRLVVKHAFLWRAVEAHALGASDAAKLAEAAEANGAIDLLEKELDEFIAEKTIALEAEKAEAKKLGRELTGSKAQVKKFVTPRLVKAWTECLKEGRSFSEAEAKTTFGASIDEAARKLTISGVNASLDDLSSDELKAILAEAEALPRKLVKHILRAELIERTTSVDDDQLDEALARIREEARQASETTEKAEAGRQPTEQLAVATPEAMNVDDVIDELLDEADADDEQG